jgi:hypothetical protein
MSASSSKLLINTTVINDTRSCGRYVKPPTLPFLDSRQFDTLENADSYELLCRCLRSNHKQHLQELQTTNKTFAEKNQSGQSPNHPNISELILYSQHRLRPTCNSAVTAAAANERVCPDLKMMYY